MVIAPQATAAATCNASSKSRIGTLAAYRTLSVDVGATCTNRRRSSRNALVSLRSRDHVLGLRPMLLNAVTADSESSEWRKPESGYGKAKGSRRFGRMG